MTDGVAAHQPRRRPAVSLLAVLALSAACTAAPAATDNGHADHGHGDMDMADMASAPTAPAVAEAEPGGNGLSAGAGGYSFAPLDVTAPDKFTFRITGPDGRAVTRYQPYQSKLLVLYVIRADLSAFRVLDPAMREDGTWIASLSPTLPPGSYRAFATFAAPDSSQGTPLRRTLSQAFTVPGSAPADPLPAASTTSTVDGFTATWVGQPKAGVSSPLGVSVATGGKTVEYVDRLLDGYVHLTAFHAGDLAFAHFFATGKDSTGLLTANAVFPENGTWRLFARFQVNGQPHTAAFTVVVP